MGVGMNLSETKIEVFDPQEATTEEWDRFFDYSDEIFIELNPGDPVPPREFRKKWMLDPHPHYKVFRYQLIGIESNSEMIGYAVVTITLKEAPSFETNKHIANVWLSVKQEHRQQGIGTKLLNVTLQRVEKTGRSVIQTGTTHDAGNAFCEHFNGILAMEGAENRLQIDDIDWKLLDDWKSDGPKRAPGVKLEIFEVVHDDDIEEYVDLYTETLNQQPLGEIESRARVTPSSRRLSEKRMKEKGVEWITLISREPDGSISGLTEIFYTKDIPYQISQNLTGVREKYRGRGLGKWLKAEMAFIFRERYSDVEYVETGNANENAPMLSINERMGFKKHQGGTSYKFNVKDLTQKLQENIRIKVF
jgi:GNAT superfamily N-acetyltransferase